MHFIQIPLALILLFAQQPPGDESRRRTADIHGNGTAGPYSLGFEKIVQGSERIQVDGVQIGVENYQIDYQQGLILFANNRTIPETSIIHVTFVVEEQPKEKSRWEKWLDALAEDFTVSGFWTSSYRNLVVDGNQSTYANDNFGNEGSFSSNSEFYISGKMFNYIYADMTVSRNRYFPTDQRLNLRYERRGTKLEVGDINLRLTGNDIVSFSKNVKGLQFDTTLWGKGHFSYIESTAKHSTRSVTLRGNNTSGPYYLGYFPIVDGSERVRVDEVDRSSADYEIEYETGVLYFKRDLIIPETSIIEVTFETRTTLRTGGAIKGFRIEYPVSSALRMGYIQLEQNAGPETTESDTVLWTDNLLGDGTPGPYQLYHGPVVEGSETVRVEGVPQARDQDYRIDYALGIIFFNYPVALDQNIVVAYRQGVDRAVTGNRKVTGYDLLYKPFDNLTLSYQLGRSNANADGEVGGGSARTLQITYGLNRAGKGGRRVPLLSLAANDSRMDTDFATIENASFRRNSTGTTYNLTLTPWDFVSFDYDRITATRPRGFSSIPGQDTGLVEFGSDNWKVRLGFPNYPEVTYSSAKTSNIDDLEPHQYAVGQTTDTLQYSWTRGKASVSGSRTATRNDNYVEEDYASGSRSSRIALAYLSSERLSFSTDFSKSAIEGSTGNQSHADTQRFHIYFAPWETLSLTADFSNQTSTGTVAGSQYFPYESRDRTSFPASAFGSPLYRLLVENGFDPWTAAEFVTRGRQSDGQDQGTTGTQMSSKNLTLAWNPSPKLTATLTYYSSVSDAQYTSNSDSERKGITLGWTPNDLFSVMAAFSQDVLKYIGEEGSMSSDNASLTVRYGPWRKFTLDLNYYKMSSGHNFSFTQLPGQSGGDQSTAIESLSFNLRRPIGVKTNAYLTYQQSSGTGFRASERTNVELGVSYSITEHLTFSLGAEATDYQDKTDPQYNYSLRSVGANLDLRF